MDVLLGQNYEFKHGSLALHICIGYTIRLSELFTVLDINIQADLLIVHACTYAFDCLLMCLCSGFSQGGLVGINYFHEQCQYMSSMHHHYIMDMMNIYKPIHIIIVNIY